MDDNSMKKIFIHTIEIFDAQILVVVGLTAEQVDKWIKKNGLKSVKNIMNKKISDKFTEASKSEGFVLSMSNNSNKNFYILWLKDFKYDNNFLDILNHEVVHLRQFMFSDRNIKDEIEFEAYFQESVNRELRRRLYKFLKNGR